MLVEVAEALQAAELMANIVRLLAAFADRQLDLLASAPQDHEIYETLAYLTPVNVAFWALECAKMVREFAHEADRQSLLESLKVSVLR